MQVYATKLQVYTERAFHMLLATPELSKPLTCFKPLR